MNTAETSSAAAAAGANVVNRAYPQKLAFYHPNSAGNGVAMQLEPRFNRLEKDRYNCFFLEMASQKTGAGRSGDKRVPATFDWEKKLAAKLDFTDICELLAVFEGRQDKVGGQKGGLFHQNGQGSTVISLQKAEKGGYYIGLSKKNGEAAAVRVSMLISEAEAIGLRSVFQSSLFFLSFHSHIFQAAG